MSCSHDEAVRIWDAHTGGPAKELAEPEWKPIGTPYPLFACDGRTLIIVWAEHYRAYDTDSWTASPPVSRSGRLYHAAALHRSGLLAESDEAQTSIELRDLASGELITRLQSPSASHVSQLAFSPDGTRMAIAYNNSPEVRVWDLRLLREELKAMGMD